MSLISGFSALVAASLLSGQTVPTQERPEALTRLMACRPIADSAARLACFDAAAGALDTAERAGDVVVIDRAGVAVRAGTHCAQPLLKRFGVTSTCRASFGMYNTRAEVDKLADALDHARTFFA